MTQQSLLDDYDLYDQYVDVVSAFEWLFTGTIELTPTVRHFERYPRITTPDGTVVTPDFTVLFHDGTGLVGEVAKIALHENSVDKVCDQIGKYAQLAHLPSDSRGGTAPVTDLDVLQLVPAEVGLSAVNRIIKERYLNPDHAYAPPKPPVIAQFSRSIFRDDFRYTFQRIPDPDNGTLPVSEDPATIGLLLTTDSNVPARKFKDVKARRKFMNDPIKPLYLATHLWTSTWPTEYGSETADIEVKPADIANTLRKQYGVGRAAEVKAALELLAQAGLAADNGDGTWVVSRKTLRLRGERDIHRVIAIKAGRRDSPIVTPRHRRPKSPPETEQGSLF
ncbi:MULTISPECIES: hypothetical protein [unclassified Nocardioides]|uniref:hypothetical protein n=1 Tax=unclassified Nocardioides TaxID=2615069 RepID=UPI0005A140A1|nr:MULTISPECIES: hypothetical protein [unclassified Nocardioides]